MKNLLLIFFINLLLLTIVFAQTNLNSQIKQIDNYVKKVSTSTKRQKEPNLVFADVSQNAKSKWRKFSSTKLLEKFREKTETYSISHNWLVKNKITISVFTLFSESGDWANYIYYYFRQDGSLAKIESEYRTFYGHFAAIQNIYFNEKGKIIKKNIKYLDLENMKRKSVSKDDLADNTTLFNFDFYKKTSNLPFAHLLKKK